MLQGPIGARAEATTSGGAGEGPAPGPRVGPWDIEAELGRGGMGVVLRARHHQTGQPVALKLLPPHLAAVSDHALRFQVEARAAARLRHPAVVGVVDAGEHAGRRWLAMELVPGESLHARLRRAGPLPEVEAAELGARLARGLAHAHALDVLHRDIKPSNVLLGKDGPRLADFGLAKLTDPGAGTLTASGETLGTPPYMSPEQAYGKPLDARADVYQLGATLYEVLTGRPPFTGASAVEVLTAVATSLPAPIESLRPGVDPALAQLVRRAMAPRLADRFPSAGHLAEALEGWLRARAPDGGAGRRPRRRRGRRPWALAGGAAALLAVAGGVALAIRRPTAPAPVVPPPTPTTTPTPPTTPTTPTPPPPPTPTPPPTPPTTPTTPPTTEPPAGPDPIAARLEAATPPTDAELDELLAQAPRHGGALALRARRRLVAGDFAAALADAEAATRGQPPAPRAAVARTLGVARYRLGDDRAAIPDLEAAFRAAPDDLEVASTLGFAARRWQHPALASDAFRAARRLYRARGEPPSWSLPFNLAGSVANLSAPADRTPEELAEIEEAYREAHALALAQTRGEGVAWPLIRLAQVLMGAKRLAEAEEAIDEADEIARRTRLPVYRQDVLGARIALLCARGRAPEAVALGRGAVTAEPAELASHLMLANALLADGQLDEALRSAREALRLAELRAATEPNVDLNARNTLARVEAALAERDRR